MHLHYNIFLLFYNTTNKSSIGSSVAVLCHWSPPLGPMPNEDIDGTQLDSLEKYRSYTRYVRAAEEADRRDVWWKTYRQYREEETKEGKSSLRYEYTVTPIKEVV